jgi:hypothetical protein
MTLTQFFTTLKACRTQIVWHPHAETIRGHLRRERNLALIECCPLTAVAYAQTGMPFSVVKPLMAAAELGIPKDMAYDIVLAADSHRCDGTDCRACAIRARLLACVGRG